MNTSNSHDHIDLDSATLLPENMIINEPPQFPLNDNNQLLNEYKQTNSLWPNIFFGTGMLALIVIPPLLPGASIRVLTAGYMLLIDGIYIVAAIMTAMKVWRPRNSLKQRTGRKY